MSSDESVSIAMGAKRFVSDASSGDSSSEVSSDPGSVFDSNRQHAFITESSSSVISLPSRSEVKGLEVALTDVNRVVSDVSVKTSQKPRIPLPASCRVTERSLLSPPVTIDSDATPAWSGSSDVDSFYVSEVSDNILINRNDGQIESFGALMRHLVTPMAWNQIHAEIYADSVVKSDVFQIVKTPIGSYKCKPRSGKPSINQRIWKYLWVKKWKLSEVTETRIATIRKVVNNWSRDNNFGARRFYVLLALKRLESARTTGTCINKQTIARIPHAGMKVCKIQPPKFRMSVTADFGRQSIGPPRRSLSQPLNIGHRFSLVKNDIPSPRRRFDCPRGVFLSDKEILVRKVLGLNRFSR